MIAGSEYLFDTYVKLELISLGGGWAGVADGEGEDLEYLELVYLPRLYRRPRDRERATEMRNAARRVSSSTVGITPRVQGDAQPPGEGEGVGDYCRAAAPLYVFATAKSRHESKD